MNRYLACGLLMAFLGAGCDWAQHEFLDDQIELLQPGLTTSIVLACDAEPYRGSFLCDRNPVAAWLLPDQIDGFVNAGGNFYQWQIRDPTPEEANAWLPVMGKVYEMQMRTGEGVGLGVRLPQRKVLCRYDAGIFCVPGCTSGSETYQDTAIVHMGFDSINGDLYLGIYSAVGGPCDFGGNAKGIVRI